MKDHKWAFVLSTLAILLPAVVGLCIWDRLPERVPTHFGFDGEPNAWSSPAVLVLGMPVVLLALHWFCLWITLREPQNRDQSPRVMTLLFATTPAITWAVYVVLYGRCLGYIEDPVLLPMLLVSGMIAVFGNFMPKFKQNRSMGFRVSWTLNDEGCWLATHRFGGRLWFWGGILLMAISLWSHPVAWVFWFAILLALIVLPLVYAWRYARKHPAVTQPQA